MGNFKEKLLRCQHRLHTAVELSEDVLKVIGFIVIIGGSIGGILIWLRNLPAWIFYPSFFFIMLGIALLAMSYKIKRAKKLTAYSEPPKQPAPMSMKTEQISG